MAMKLSTRKRPERSDKMLKESQLKFSERVFDDNTIKTLKYLMNNEIFRSLDYPIQHGKEAAVYRGTAIHDGKEEFVAVKIFKLEGPSFQKKLQYLEGDKRFDRPRGKRHMVKIFAKKEFANLKICQEAGVRAPRPIKHRDNVVVMEFLGEKGVPSGLLKNHEMKSPKKILGEVLEDMKKMHGAKLVHVDLSEFNIIMHKEMPYIIDVGQAVLLHHPQSEEFLRRDLLNVLKFFEKNGARMDFDEALKYIRGENVN
ncbi:MAG: serine protein kinase RIO [Candidatus Micrarchaeota archaeon]